MIGGYSSCTSPNIKITYCDLSYNQSNQLQMALRKNRWLLLFIIPQPPNCHCTVRPDLPGHGTTRATSLVDYCAVLLTKDCTSLMDYEIT